MKQELVVIKKENDILKEENEVSKEKLKELEILKNDALGLKQQVETISTVLQELKNGNSKLIDKSKITDMCASSEIAVAKHEPVHITLKKEVKNIDSLKEKLIHAHTLKGKVSFVNDDKVMIIKSNKRSIDFNKQNLSTCYKENNFQNIFDQFGLKGEKKIMIELLKKVKYHLYDCKFNGSQRYSFVFPLDLQNINDIEVVVPYIFIMNIKYNELIVQKLNRSITISYVFIEKYQIKFELEMRLTFNN